MDRDKLKALLSELDINSGRRGIFKDSGDNIMMCCPWHNESRPSCGIHAEKLIGNCYGCGETFSLPKLVAYCKDIPIYKAINWLEDKFNVEKKVVTKEFRLPRYEETPQDYIELPRHEQPLMKIAKFRSGRETHDYFFNRGFTASTVKKFMIGWDTKLMRVTMPVFWGDGKLSGVIGRAVLEEKINGEENREYTKIYRGMNSPRYYIYDAFPTGNILFPLNHFKPINKTLILVEGGWDAMWLHQLGFTNVLATLTTKMAHSQGECRQAKLIEDLNIDTIILFKDNDKAGIRGAESDYNLLKGKYFIYGVTYPHGANDPAQLSKEQITTMLDNKHLYAVDKISKKLSVSRIV